MASLTALAILLARALGGDFVVEQPGSSLLWRHPRLQWVCGLVKVGQVVKAFIDPPFSGVPRVVLDGPLRPPKS